MSLPSGASLAIANAPANASRWRWRSLWVSLGCCALGIVCFGIQLDVFISDHGENLPSRLETVLVWDFLLGLAAGAVCGSMHRAARWNLVFIAAAGVSSFAMPAAAVAMVRLGARRRRLDDALVVIVSVVALGLVNPAVTKPSVGYAWSDLADVPVVLAIAWGFIMWGRSRGDREALIVSLRDEASAAQRERDALDRERAALASRRAADLARTRADERTAIARDMHDSLSHHLSLIAMHAGALAYRDDLPPEQMRTTARTLRDAAEAANSELRDVLVALRAHDGAPPTPSTSPLPTPRTMADTLTAARERGQRIAVTYEEMAESDLGDLPPTSAAALNRIVGELVVNAGKHAVGSPLMLTFTRTADDLVVRAVSPMTSAAQPRTAGAASPGRHALEGRAVGSGLGLAGVSERARLLGGSVTVVESPDFTVEVHIPWRH